MHNNNFKHHQESRSKDNKLFNPVYCFQVCIQIGDGRCETVCMNQKSDPYQVALEFCEKFNIEKSIVGLLRDSLEQQAKKQQESAKNFHNQSLHKTEEENSKMIGAQKVLSASSRKYYAWNKGSQQIWKEQQSPLGYPKINDISKEIVNKIGKQTIIDYMTKRSEDKVYQYILDKIQNEVKQNEQYSFHPTINPISQQVDKTLKTISRGQVSRFDQLYDYSKLYADKMRERRKNSMKQLSFKPEINNLSKQIMSKKKSQNNIHSNTKPTIRQKSYHQESQHRHSVSVSGQKNKKRYRGQSGQLGQNLYQEAKRRQEKSKKESEKYLKRENWKITQHSNEMIVHLRQCRIRQIFQNLTRPPHEYLTIQDTQHEHLSNVQKLFIPIFKEMKQLNTYLTQEQFLQAGMRLLDYLSPLQRAMLVRKDNKKIQYQDKDYDKENFTAVMNEKSRQIVKQKGYGSSFDIYRRGLLYKRQIKQQVQKGREDKVRRQLKNCTFQPKISDLPQNYAY